MIKTFIEKIKSLFKDMTKHQNLVKLISKFTEEDWNLLTTVVIMDLYGKGEKQYTTLNKFIDAHVPSVEFSDKLQDCDISYRDILMHSIKLTTDQKKLLTSCKSRKINSGIVVILETIDEYDNTNKFSDYSNSIVFDDLDK